ncbi:MAG: hypothetical protein GY868_15505 [Deltaproteobacteria bacterium]|nr:hypothetical protein [Deltaproteobacteria bacterium]
MTIAIPLFGTRISPRFDCAPTLLLVYTDKQKAAVKEQTELKLHAGDSLERIKQLTTAGVNMLICGGITTEERAILTTQHIKVIPWVTGEAEKALQVFLQGRLKPGSIICPGRKIGRWQFCEQGRNKGCGNKE